MAWEVCVLGVFCNHVLVVLVHLGFLLRVLLLLRPILQPVVGCCYTLVVDIGVVLWAGISVWGVVQRWFVARAHRCSWSTLPFDSSWLAVVLRRAAGEMHSSVLHARGLLLPFVPLGSPYAS